MASTSSVGPADLQKNIEQGNCFRADLNGHKKGITGLDVDFKAMLAVSVDPDSLNIWDLSRGKWTYAVTPPASSKWDNFVRIVNGKIVAITVKLLENGIHLCNPSTGKIEKSINPNIDPKKICIIGQSIYGVLADGSLMEWSFDGVLKGCLAKFKPGSAMRFVHDDNYIVFDQMREVIIYNIKEPLKTKTVALKTKDSDFDKTLVACITALRIEGKRVLCGYSTIEDKEFRAPHGCIIDMEKGEMLNYFRFQAAFPKQIWSICKIQNILFFGCDKRGIIWCNTDAVEQKRPACRGTSAGHSSTGYPNKAVFCLTGDDHIFVAGTEIDCSLFTLSGVMLNRFPVSISQLFYSAGKVVIASENRLTCIDFNVTHTGQKNPHIWCTIQ